MKIYHQSVFDPWPLDDRSIQAIITSPPYWGLRKYDIPDVIISRRGEERRGEERRGGCLHEWYTARLPKGNGDGKSYRRDDQGGIAKGEQSGFCIHCGAWKGQHGLEPDFRLYIEHVRLWAREAWRVLRDDGVFFLNLGDSYGGSWGAYGDGTMKGNQKRKKQSERWARQGAPLGIIPPTVNATAKCKLLIPYRVAIALMDDGWICRNDIIWHKINAMPESVKDRFNNRKEYIFMFTKKPKYYCDIDAVRAPHKEKTFTTLGTVRREAHYADDLQFVKSHRFLAGKERKLNEKGVTPGDIWEFCAQASPEKHYAMWPESLVRRMILCSTRPGDAILDCFCGSGRTLKVTDELNREAVGIDLGYKDIQKRQLKEIQKNLIEGRSGHADSAL